jgi:hypothetical protein
MHFRTLRSGAPRVSGSPTVRAGCRRGGPSRAWSTRPRRAPSSGCAGDSVAALAEVAEVAVLDLDETSDPVGAT